ncbi:MAG: hypothetical protein KF914_21775 [Rhizobiaceae bacterium]|nr:hypothetical protein [Rhizobiaceae bacterium]
MGEVPRSLRIDAELSRRLDEEARRQDVPADSIAEQAIERYLGDQEAERRILRERALAADRGVFISSEAMLRWLGELDDNIDAPAPAPDVFTKRG